MSTPHTTVLASRDVNISPKKASIIKGGEPFCTASEEKVSDIGEKDQGDQQEKGKGSEEGQPSIGKHPQALHARLDAKKSNSSTWSPSDIVSPITLKIQALNKKRYWKAKPQSLFATSETKPTATTTNEDGPQSEQSH
ncbi:hypothetical protein MMC07_006546 [Pseudocyphellaria aurata]|nr:hypothetical protein [Pseudocyphellaria aurata]